MRVFPVQVPEGSTDWAPDPEVTVDSVDAPTAVAEPEAESEAELAQPASLDTQEEATAFEDLTSLASEALAELSESRPSAQDDATGSLSVGASRFGSRDPHDRAKRLARVLVSDIIAYYPSRYRESFKRGKLKEDFDEEIEKSRREYAEQVGEEVADSTPYFRDALNEILAKGEDVF